MGLMGQTNLTPLLKMENLQSQVKYQSLIGRQNIDTPPFRAYPVTGGITFTYGGVKVSQEAAVLNDTSSKIEGLFACGEMVGGVFLNGYPRRIWPHLRSSFWAHSWSKCSILLKIIMYGRVSTNVYHQIFKMVRILKLQ